MSKKSQTEMETQKVQPRSTEGAVPILGKDIQVGAGTVPSSKGVQPKIVTALRKAARKGIFPPAPVPAMSE